LHSIALHFSIVNRVYANGYIEIIDDNINNSSFAITARDYRISAFPYY